MNTDDPDQKIVLIEIYRNGIILLIFGYLITITVFLLESFYFVYKFWK